tara:strand:- start:368 stop:1051 length:684 start_codon:yes stop_codon:yes gene_type:complete
MKIALFTSGKVRTLFYKFHKNLELIRDRYPNCEIDVFYSFWDSLDRIHNINDPWHFKAENYTLDNLSEDVIDNYFSIHGVKSVGEIESTEIMNQVISESPFPESHSGLSSQYYKMHRVTEKYFDDSYDLYVRIRSDILINNFPLINFFEDNTVAINLNFWYNQPYDGDNCYEGILVSTKKSFLKCNQLYLNQEKFMNGYGELIMGSYLKSLSEISLKTFNFKYRVVR